MSTTSIAIDAIRADERCQPRATFDNELVSQYAEAMANGDEFPPVTVFYDGVDHFLADGFHRYHGAKSFGLTDIAATVREGTLRDAILFSCSANANHGWRRTNDDKRRAVLRLLNDAEWSKWSDREIARRCLVGADMVGRLRPADTVAERQYEPRTFIHPKTGQPTQMRTANIGTAPRHDAPVFDTTPSGEGWRDTAAPEMAAAVSNVSRETWLANSIWEVVKVYERLPGPTDAARRFPDLLLHSIDPKKLHAASRWLADFASEIELKKDHMHVAAE